MLTFSKLLVLLLVAALSGAPLAAHGLGSNAPAHERPAGCHEDGGDLPAPLPTSHSCCQGMHHPAILQPGSSLRPSTQISAPVEYSRDVAVVAAFNSPSSLVIESGGPPVISPLRV